MYALGLSSPGFDFLIADYSFHAIRARSNGKEIREMKGHICSTPGGSTPLGPGSSVPFPGQRNGTIPR